MCGSAAVVEAVVLSGNGSGSLQSAIGRGPIAGRRPERGFRWHGLRLIALNIGLAVRSRVFFRSNGVVCSLSSPAVVERLYSAAVHRLAEVSTSLLHLTSILTT